MVYCIEVFLILKSTKLKIENIQINLLLKIKFKDQIIKFQNNKEYKKQWLSEKKKTIRGSQFRHNLTKKKVTLVKCREPTGIVRTNLQPEGSLQSRSRSLSLIYNIEYNFSFFKDFKVNTGKEKKLPLSQL